MINKLNEVMENIDICYSIYNNIYRNYDKKNTNYEILQNVNEINNNSIFFNIILSYILKVTIFNNNIKYIFN